MSIATPKQVVHRICAQVVNLILKPGAVVDSKNFRLWEKQGYHITPTHFYSPIPLTDELKNLDFKPSECPGIDLRAEFQLSLMRNAFAQYAPEYNSLPKHPTLKNEFYLENDAFRGIDPHIYHCIIRHFKPKTVIEVGSGFSTLLGAKSSASNDACRYICIDPWPREFIAKGVPNIEFIGQRVEKLDLDIFNTLGENDVLFVDSSHVVRTGSDVCFMILEILPRLKPGVIIHFHDIFLPDEYPKEWMLDEQRFWTEQYLLQAYLAENNSVEVLFANHFISTRYPNETRKTFPEATHIDGGSFWLRKL